MSDFTSPEFDLELFGEDVLSQFNENFEANGFFDFTAASFDPVQPAAEPSDDLPAPSIEGVSLADIEGPEGLQDAEWTNMSAPNPTEDLLGDTSFDWTYADVTENPGGLQGADWDNLPTHQGSEELQAGPGEAVLTVDQGTEVHQAAPSQGPVEAMWADGERSIEDQINDLRELCSKSIELSPINFEFFSEISSSQLPTSSPAAMTPRRQSTPQTPPNNYMMAPQNNYMMTPHTDYTMTPQNGYMMTPQNGYTMTPQSNITSSAQNNSMVTPQTSVRQTATPTPTPSRKTKARAPAKPRAPSAKRTTTTTNKVTKASHKRSTSAPSRSTTTASPARERSLQELYAAQWSTLTQTEKARILLPLLQGIDPETGLQRGQPGTLAANCEDIGANLFQTQTQTPAMGFGTDMGMNNGMQMNSGMDMAPGMAMVQQTAAELGMQGDMDGAHGYGLTRQQEALQRAEMLKQMGRRR